MKKKLAEKVEVDKEIKEMRLALKDLFANHNDLITRYNNLTDDAEALLSYIKDLGQGMAAFGLDEPIGDNLLIKGFGVLEIIGALPEEKKFAIEVYNQIAIFVKAIEDLKRPVEAYDDWLEECREAARREGGAYNE